MKKILMLDLEGVLIDSVRYGRWRTETRTHSQYFVSSCFRIFDEVWLNTCVKEDLAREVMRTSFGITDVGYHNFRKLHEQHYVKGGGLKTVGYDKFENDLLIHVEDGISDKEREDIQSLPSGHYVNVRTWLPNSERKTDDIELLNVLDRIKKITS